MAIELLTAGTWHDSIGDIAIMQTMQNEMALRGVPVVSQSHWSGSGSAIIGGGWLLHPNGMQDPILAPFHIGGQHVLNAVSVASGEGNFEHLKHYKLVTVRDEFSRQQLLPFRSDAKCVPCSTVLLKRPNIDYLTNCHGYRWLKTLKERKGEFVVYDIELEKMVGDYIHRIPVDTRGFMRRKSDGKLCEHRNPEALLALISQAKCVITASLHLSIFSMAMGVPFVWPNQGQFASKGINYWGRAGFPEACCEVGTDLLAHALNYRAKMLDVRGDEIRRATEHLDEIATLLKE